MEMCLEELCTAYIYLPEFSIFNFRQLKSSLLSSIYNVPVFTPAHTQT